MYCREINEIAYQYALYLTTPVTLPTLTTQVLLLEIHGMIEA